MAAQFNFEVKDPVDKFSASLLPEEREKLRVFSAETHIPMSEVFRNFSDAILRDDKVVDILPFVEPNGWRVGGGRKWVHSHFSILESDLEDLHMVAKCLDTTVNKLFRGYLKLMGIA